MPEIVIGTLEDFPPDQVRTVSVNGAPVAVVRIGDQVYACGAVCAHRGGPLGEGRLTGTRLVCPWHGWFYDVRTGECVMPARGGRVPTYPVRVEAGQVRVEA